MTERLEQRTLAENVANAALLSMGYRDPEKAEVRESVREAVQGSINEAVFDMAVVAGREAIPSEETFYKYEVASIPLAWAVWLLPWTIGPVARRLSKRASRKYKAFRSVRLEEFGLSVSSNPQ
ncbi:MAG: hypothetical protein Aurels2KO_54580 [Aureliella sp.]